MAKHIWRDTIDANGRLIVELSGTRVRACVLVLPITYGRSAKTRKTGYAFCYGARGGVVSDFNQAKWHVEQMAEHFEQRAKII